MVSLLYRHLYDHEPKKLTSSQILNNYSYRETLEEAKDEGFNVPSLCDYHYRVKKLDDELLKSILEECANLLLEDKQILCYIADATGFGFGDKYKLNWERGTQIRTVQSHVRLEAVLKTQTH